jgi:hypothetical protein
MKATAERALSSGVSPVPSEVVIQAQKEFSNYLRSEMEDEIGGLYPDVKAVLNTVAHIRKPLFTTMDFARAYKASVARGECVERSWEDVLRVLFHFSVVGNFTRTSKTVFSYTNREARLNLTEPLTVHPGLLRAFQL